MKPRCTVWSAPPRYATNIRGYRFREIPERSIWSDGSRPERDRRHRERCNRRQRFLNISPGTYNTFYESIYG